MTEAEIIEINKKSESIDETDSVDAKYFYLCGIVTSNKGKRLIDFVFPYTDDELNAAMMEEIQYNSSTEDERKNMTLKHKQKFSQGFLLASYRKRMDDVKIYLFRSINDIPKDEFERIIIEDIDDAKMDRAIVPI